MKAAVYYQTGPPDVFSYEDVPDPVVYPGGVVVAVEAISIDGGDTLNRAGGEMTSKPHIVGYQRAGATVIATASSDDRLERLKEFGLDHGVNYAHDGWVDAVRALTTDGRGV